MAFIFETHLNYSHVQAVYPINDANYKTYSAFKCYKHTKIVATIIENKRSHNGVYITEEFATRGSHMHLQIRSFFLFTAVTWLAAGT